MKTPDDSDDDGAEDDGDDGDFDGMSHRTLTVSQWSFKHDYMQITITTPVQRWISRRMDMQVLQIPTPVCLARKIWPGGTLTDQRPRYILFEGQT